MQTTHWKRMGALLFAAALAMAGCSGDTGSVGPPGSDGTPGQNTGTISGAVKMSTGAAVANATVTTVPDVGATATTNGSGVYTLSSVPIGTYTLVVEGTGVTRKEVAGVVVVASTTTTQNIEVAYSPFKITFGAVPNPAGFGKAVTLSPTITRLDGAALGTLTYTWSIQSGPTANASSFSATNVASPAFTTGTIKAMIDGGKLRNFRVPGRDGLLTVTAQNVTDMTYTLKLAISDGTYSQSGTVSVPCAIATPGQNAGGTQTVAIGIPVLANTAAVDTNGWSLDKSGATGSQAVLEGASTNNPWFIPDVPGAYILKNGAAVVSTITAAKWVGAPSADCGFCHPAGAKAAVEAKFKDWRNSAHGNHFWKYFEYDASGNLVPKGGTSVVVPTATDGVSWTISAPMTTFEFGVTGGEGGHYSESCAVCHTVGLNKAIANDGLDDIAGYAFPNLGASTDPAFKTPLLTNFSNMPAGVKNRAGIQCENCHGPLGRHNNAATAPKAVYGAGACAVCHDAGSHHDRFNLWAQGGHSNLALAEEEGKSTDCGRCHSAQGFVEWAKNGFGTSYKLGTAPSAADVEPQTCQACHDPHTTELRVDESKPIAITSGFTVSGAGAGQLCVICHSSRRGRHDDGVTNSSYSLPHRGAQSDLFFGKNLYFVSADDIASGATMSTHALVIEGTCVGCHMEKALAYEGLTAPPSSTNHSFKVSSNVCGVCHEGASFEALKTRTEAGLADLTASIAAAARRSIPATAGFKATLPNPAGQSCNLVATFTAVPRPTTVTVGLPSGHGAGFTFTWDSDVTYRIYAADNTTVDCDPNTTGTQPITSDIGPVTITANTAQGVVLDAKLTTVDGATQLILASGDLFKAWWNMALIEDEGSSGGHNPGLTQQVLAVSKLKADAVAP